MKSIWAWRPLPLKVGAGCVLLLLALCAAGCVTPQRPTGATGVDPSAAGSERSESVAGRELSECRRLIRGGDFARALPRLMQLIQLYPKTSAARESRFFLGLVYFQIENYPDAQACFQEYVRQRPDTAYAAVAKDCLTQLSDPATFHKEAIATLKKRLEDLAGQEILSQEERIKAIEDSLRLADLEWKSDKFEEAGALYRQLLVNHPELAQMSPVRERLEKKADGSWLVVTPQEVERRAAAANPVYVYDTNNYTTREARGWGRDSQAVYHVTGKVRNRGDRPVSQVMVYVTVYTSGSMVHDAKSVSIGALRPKEERAFHESFQNFDYLSNIGRYECKLQYE